MKFAELVKLEDKGVSTAPLSFYNFLFHCFLSSFLSFPPYSYNVIFLFIFVFRVGKAGRQRGSTAHVFFCSFHFPYYFPLFFPLSPSYHFNMIVLFILVSWIGKVWRPQCLLYFVLVIPFSFYFAKQLSNHVSCQESLFYF